MNPNIEMSRDYEFEKRVLELTSDGYNTREAKRKAKRESRKEKKKLMKQMGEVKIFSL